MTPPILLNGLSDIASDYDALLCDIWGVLHNGLYHFPDAYEALRHFKAAHGPVILISNSPRPNDGLKTQLADLKVYEDGYSGIVSSGDATRTYLKSYAPSGSAWVIGPPRDEHLYTGLDIVLTGTPKTAAFISCTGLYNDEADTVAMYETNLRIASERGITMICANPDRIVQRGDQIIACAGALADLYIELGGKVIMAGKPYPPIYELCYEALKTQTQKPLDKRRILAIGDGLPTDVLGANAQDIDLLFVAAGIHAAEATDASGKLDPNLLTQVLDSEKAHARYVAHALQW
jgi:HAD superfamily hydrolase (TIGR01459 family)